WSSIPQQVLCPLQPHQLKSGSSRSGEHRIEGPTGEDGVEGSQKRLALLAQRRQVAADRRVRRRAVVSAKTASDLLRDLEPAQIALGLVVGEGNREVVEEDEHLVLAEEEAPQSIAGGRLCQPSALARWTGLVGWWWVGREPGGQERLVPLDELCALGVCEVAR